MGKFKSGIWSTYDLFIIKMHVKWKHYIYINIKLFKVDDED